MTNKSTGRHVTADDGNDEDGRRYGFVTLDSYVEPSLETSGAVRRMAEDLLSRLRPGRHKRVKFYDKLWQIDDEIKDSIAPPPSCGPLVDDLDHSFREWLKADDSQELTRLIVYPPGHRAQFLRKWSDRVGARMLECDFERRADAVDALTSVGPDEVLVVPSLQDWFLRVVGGMDTLQLLLVTLARMPNRVIVGCDSWAWQFLIKSVNAHHLMPEALVFTPFDEERLRDWIAGLVDRMSPRRELAFRSARDGSDIFEPDGDSTYFRDLAAESLGIPWVAWSLWRDSLFTTQRDELDGDVWVRPPTFPALPDTDERESLLILHALLIHDGLRIEDLAKVLPFVGTSTTLAMLDSAGFVREEGDHYRVSRPVYPTVKGALEDAGYPGDGI